MTTPGRNFGWKMIFFICVSELVMTLARPTSEPVPAVVGTATIGAMPSTLARVHQSPISSKSQTGRVCPAMKATHLPRSRPEPPPKATTPSWPPSLKALTPASRFFVVRVRIDIGEDRAAETGVFKDVERILGDRPSARGRGR